MAIRIAKTAALLFGLMIVGAFSQPAIITNHLAGSNSQSSELNDGAVTLAVTVVDNKRQLVNDLKVDDFSVYENGQLQQITAFRHEDIPVSIGIVADNSGSMREKRVAVTAAVLELVKRSNPRDEFFVVNFNDDSFLDQDFTSDASLLHEALDRLDSRGGTALYDAVIASAGHLDKAAKLEKKVLLVITDGEDNESKKSLEQAIRSVQNKNGPMVYTIGILGSEGKLHRARRSLEELALNTGGVAFFPKTLSDVNTICRAIADDLRHQYSITYKPINPDANRGYRQIKVVVRSPSYQDLITRATSGYFAGGPQAAK